MSEPDTWNLAGGYRFAGVHGGLHSEPDRLDVALVVSDRPAVVAGAFTQNRVVAAPVHVCRERSPQSEARGVVMCSGNANACTGEQGLRDARRMTEVAALEIGCAPQAMLVCSTGVIGRMLPMPEVEQGIRNAVKDLSSGADALRRSAQAILTTDTRIKVRTRKFTVAETEYRVTGFAKGAAMIGPNMATMLAFVLSDAPVALEDLSDLAPAVSAKTFNCISVEGHTSTNDTLLLFANGQGNPLTGDAWYEYRAAVTAVCTDLARDMVDDAEGASHTVTIDVIGLRDDVEAHRVAKTVAESALVKTAIFGADPNWGRIVSATGYAGVEFEESQLSLWLNDVLLYERGTPKPIDEEAVSHAIKQNREVHMRLEFTIGEGRCTFYTCDLTYEYVRLNAEYTT